jgi:hypothetical protein
MACSLFGERTPGLAAGKIVVSLFPTAWVFAISTINAYRSTSGRTAGHNLSE